jgi:flavin reductase (DIM6/NTAB) family NADH-FMN oxidoreductase RutF
MVNAVETVGPQLGALARLPLAVVVVAAADGATRSCSTGTAAYASLEPPLIVTPLAEASRTRVLAAATGEFSVSVLAAGQAELAVRAAARSTGDKFAEQGIEARDPPAGRLAPGVGGAVAVFWCDVEAMVPAGAHVLCVGRLREWAPGEGEPLLRFERAYRALGAHVSVPEEAAYPL